MLMWLYVCVCVCVCARVGVYNNSSPEPALYVCLVNIHKAIIVLVVATGQPLISMPRVGVLEPLSLSFTPHHTFSS